MAQDDDDDRMRELMLRATDQLPSPIDELVSRGMSRGRVLRRRRLVTRVAGVGACVALLAGTVAVARPLFTFSSSGNTGGVTATDQVATSGAVETKAHFSVPVAAMATTLAHLLPGSGSTQELRSWSGTSSEDSKPGPSADGHTLGPIGSGAATPFRAGSLVYEDGDGPAEVSLLVSAPDLTRPRAAAEDAEALCAQGAICTTVAAGRLVVLDNVSEAARGGTDGVISNTAILVTDDGYLITATAYNARADKKSEPTRPRPPFTGGQLGSIVTDPVWVS